MPNKLKVEYISIDDIKTYENNAKLHPAEQIEQIKKSIQEFGFNDQIAIDENNVIIEGHGRYIACTELGIKEVPIIRLEGLDEEHKKAYMLVHNKLTMNSDFDIELLSYELEDISIDMSEYGFDMEIEEEPERKDLSDKIAETYEVIIELDNEMEQEELFDRLQQEGYKCRILTL